MRKIAWLLFALGSFVAFATLRPSFIVRWLAERNPNVLFYVDTENQVTALTIDDGPHQIVTPRILDVLSAHQAHATFFLIGSRVYGNEEIVRRMVKEGHELGNHQWISTSSIRLSENEFQNQLLQTHDILANFGPIRWFRPGSGWFNQRMLQQIKDQGYRYVLGSVYPYDAYVPFIGFLSRHILRNAFSGSIIVLHDGTLGRRRTVNVLRRVLPELQRRGYRIVTLSELVERRSCD